MKRLSLTLLSLSAATAFAASPGEINIRAVLGMPGRAADAKDYVPTWMDSGTCYTARLLGDIPKDEPMGDMVIDFLGATLHEGGLGFKLNVRDDDGWMSVAEDAHPFKKHDFFEYRKLGGDDLLLVRDAVLGTVKDVLCRKSGDEDLRKRAIRNLRELGLAGVYHGPQGEVRFSRERNVIAGPWDVGDVAYTFAEAFGDTPTLMIVTEDKAQAYAMRKTLTGLVLSPMKVSATSDTGWEPDDAKGRITLTKTADADANARGRYPLTAQRVLSLTEVRFYAGEPLAENLKIMRNEMFARHNLAFKNGEMRTYFDAQAWYKPEHDNVGNLLNEIENINLMLIQTLERNVKDDATCNWIPHF